MNGSENQTFVMPNVFHDLCTYDSLCYDKENYKMLLLSNSSDRVYKEKLTNRNDEYSMGVYVSDFDRVLILWLFVYDLDLIKNSF